ncbi:MAG: glycosyltransferase family 2 protein [Candidatus Zixiibacteriota bacterium]
MNKHRRVLCILPAYNEQGKIGRVVDKVLATGQVEQVVVVDDCSTDSTSQEATDNGAYVITHRQNMGVGAAIRTGIDFGRDNGFDVAVIMSGDDQHEPEELAFVLGKLFEAPGNFVQGSRRMRGGETVDAPLFRTITTRIHSLCFSILTGQHITDSTNGFRAFYLSIFDDDGIDLDQEWLNTYELEPYLLYKAVTSTKIDVVEVPITIYYRGATREFSKMKPVRDWWRLVKPLVFLKLGLRK